MQPKRYRLRRAGVFALWGAGIALAILVSAAVVFGLIGYLIGVPFELDIKRLAVSWTIIVALTAAGNGVFGALTSRVKTRVLAHKIFGVTWMFLCVGISLWAGIAHWHTMHWVMVPVLALVSGAGIFIGCSFFKEARKSVASRL